MRETDPIPLSALQHWVYCPRQCGLIHLEQAFAENIHTARGQAVHHLVDTPGHEIRSGVRVERALPLWSDRLGLIGKADLVEFHPDGTVFPVEFKHGAKRQKLHDDLQLAAQAMCLEDMLDRPVPKGAIFHASSHRRRAVEINSALRQLVVETAEAIRAMLSSGKLPPPANDSRCKAYSLKEICQPEAINRGQVGPAEFDLREGGAVMLDDKGCRAVVTASQEPKQEEIAHPLTETRLPLALQTNPAVAYVAHRPALWPGADWNNNTVVNSVIIAEHCVPLSADLPLAAAYMKCLSLYLWRLFRCPRPAG